MRSVGATEREDADLASDLVVGFEATTGYLQLTDVVARAGDTVERRYRVVDGTVPEAGARGDVQAAAWPDDPGVVDPAGTRVTVPGPLGDLPAWELPGAGGHDDWLVAVHGRGATLAEPLRTLLAVPDHPALVVGYRNDPGAPASPDGFGHFGDTEWEDLEAALAWLRAERDPDRIVLVGYSQGASIVAACLRRCDDTGDVVGAVLASPLLSMQATLRLQARQRGLPTPVIGPLLVATKAVSWLRGGPDHARLEHVSALADLDLPLLVTHGRQDTTVPFAPSRRLADADPDQVTFLPYDGEHTRGWNVDPARWEQAVRTFVAAVT